MTDTPSNGGAPPRVDPTTVTKEAIDAVKEDLRREMGTIVRERVTALEGLRTEVMSEIRRVNDVSDQKFNGIKQQFEERDVRTENAAQESRISLDAALAAAKEAVGEQNKSNALSIDKSEVATQKQIDALVELSNTRTDALDARVSDLKGRLDRGEGTVRGEDRSGAQAVAEKAQQTATRGMIIATIGGGAYLVYLILAITTKGKF